MGIKLREIPFFAVEYVGEEDTSVRKHFIFLFNNLLVNYTSFMAFTLR